MINNDGPGLVINLGTIPPGAIHQLASLLANMCLSLGLQLWIITLSNHRLESYSIAAVLLGKNRHAAKARHQGETTPLVPEGLLDVEGSDWKRMIRNVHGAVGIRLARREGVTMHTRQVKEMLEQTPHIKNAEQGAAKVGVEFYFVSFIPVSSCQIRPLTGETTHLLQRRTSSSRTAMIHFRPNDLRNSRGREQDGVNHDIGEDDIHVGRLLLDLIEFLGFDWSAFCQSRRAKDPIIPSQNRPAHREYGVTTCNPS